MKIFMQISLVCLLGFVSPLPHSNSNELVRKKRFFDSLWPSEVKTDVNNGLIYSYLPREYLHLLPGINDHKVQRRADTQPTARFVHPTRMAVLMPHQPKSNTVQPMVKPQVNNFAQQGPKIIMKSAERLNPSLVIRSKEQNTQNHRFIPLKPAQSMNQHFNIQQQIPIKKVYDHAPTLLSIKSAQLDDFYSTKEFQELLKEFNLKVDIKNLPAISDVMVVLGTKTAEETIDAINEVAKSPEGMELIKSYLDHDDEKVEDDGFYNYEEDFGAGEIQVPGPHPIHDNSHLLGSEANSQLRATTTGTSTGSGSHSWWKPSWWGFSSGPSTKVESLQKDKEIFKNILPTLGTPSQNLNYIRNFLTPASKQSIPLESLGNPRRSFVEHPSFDGNTKVLPAVQMTEAQFQDMIKVLKLTPINAQHTQKQQKHPIPNRKQNKPILVSTEKELPIPLSNNFNESQTKAKFIAPINVQSVSTGLSHQQTLPLPSTFTQFNINETPQIIEPSVNVETENRRNFVSASDPQRATPYDFIATGKIHNANPDEVLKKSRSLAKLFEEEKSIVSAISDLTQQHHSEQGEVITEKH